MGKLTTHVLDTATGRPGTGIAFTLYRLDGDRVALLTRATNSDGRSDEPLLVGDDFVLGTYELVFNVGDYFADSSVPVSTPPFLNQVPIRFTISEDRDYHVPLLVSPWSFTTYRGS